jgi:hypothetical protein
MRMLAKKSDSAGLDPLELNEARKTYAADTAMHYWRLYVVHVLLQCHQAATSNVLETLRIENERHGTYDIRDVGVWLCRQVWIAPVLIRWNHGRWKMVK